MAGKRGNHLLAVYVGIPSEIEEEFNKWYNTQHADPSSARLGRKWWEVDPAWCVVRLLAAVGLAKDVVRAERKTIETALKRGIHPRVELGDPADAPRYLEMGVRHFCIGWDVTILHRWWAENGKRMRGLLAGAGRDAKTKRAAPSSPRVRRRRSTDCSRWPT